MLVYNLIVLATAICYTHCAPVETERQTFNSTVFETQVEDAILEALRLNNVRERLPIRITFDQLANSQETHTQSRPAEHEGTKLQETLHIDIREEITIVNDTEHVDDSPPCHVVEDEVLEKVLADIRHPDYSLVHFPEFMNVITEKNRTDNYIRPNPNGNCSYVDSDQHREPKDTGLCTWKWVTNQDLFRYPKTMMFAQCQCTTCRGRPDMACQEVYYNVRALRHKNTCIHGKYVYEPYLEPVPVACVCVPTIVVSTTNHTQQIIEQENQQRSEGSIVEDGNNEYRPERGDSSESLEEEELPRETPRSRRSHRHHSRRRQSHHHDQNQHYRYWD